MPKRLLVGLVGLADLVSTGLRSWEQEATRRGFSKREVNPKTETRS
jgi:hypothetical protein